MAQVWVVVPAFNEAENLPRIVPAILDALPDARVLVVDGMDDAIVAPAASREHLLALTSRLQEAPEQWQLQDVGHALLVPDLLVRVQQWLDHNSRAN